MSTSRPPLKEEGPGSKPVLTAGQVAVVEGIAAGKGFKAIAYELGVTEGAVRARFLNARRRLGARNMPHAVVLALFRGLIVGPAGEQGNGER